MRFDQPLIPGRLLQRYKRFLADVLLDTGESITATCPNTGSMMGLAAIGRGVLPALTGYGSLRREVKYGQSSRIDILLEGGGLPPAYVEVKNVHLLRSQGLAEFPDCRTERGVKHLEELSRVAQAGGRAVMVYLVQRGDADAFALAADLDPGYAAAFRRAREAGVEAFALGCDVTPEGIDARRLLPIAG